MPSSFAHFWFLSPVYLAFLFPFSSLLPLFCFLSHFALCIYFSPVISFNLSQFFSLFLLTWRFLLQRIYWTLRYILCWQKFGQIESCSEAVDAGGLIIVFATRQQAEKVLLFSSTIDKNLRKHNLSCLQVISLNWLQKLLKPSKMFLFYFLCLFTGCIRRHSFPWQAVDHVLVQQGSWPADTFPQHNVCRWGYGPSEWQRSRDGEWRWGRGGTRRRSRRQLRRVDDCAWGKTQVPTQLFWDVWQINCHSTKLATLLLVTLIVVNHIW